MAGEWPARQLEEIAELSGGFAFKSEDYSSEGRFVLRTLNIEDDGSIHRDAAVFLPLEKCDTYKRFELQEHDTLFVMVGATLGKVGYIRRETLPALLNQNMWRIRGRDGLCDKRYLQYAFRHTVAKNLGWASGSARDFVRRDDYRTMEIPFPPLTEQKAIAAVLGALDDKIELNRRMNATLEAMARALFQDWMKSNANDLEPRTAEDLIAKGFLVVGDGYRANNSELSNDGLPFIRAGNLMSDGLDLACAEILSAESVIAARHKIGAEGDVCFTSKGTVGRITRVCSNTGAFVYSPQVCFWRTASRENLDPHVLYQWMKNGDFMRQVNLVSTQTDMAPYVSLHDQRRMVIKLPPPPEQRNFAKQLEPIDGRISANSAQSRTLATLRDTLLPKLLSGQISASKS
ncbi:MAG: restriction endonuclease subunit S [Lacunisphaera sp.]